MSEPTRAEWLKKRIENEAPPSFISEEVVESLMQAIQIAGTLGREPKPYSKKKLEGIAASAAAIIATCHPVALETIFSSLLAIVEERKTIGACKNLDELKAIGDLDQLDDFGQPIAHDEDFK
jgi:hypothetical protein